VYDLQGRLIGEYTAQGATLREYAYLADMPAALFAQGGATYYIHADHLNTPRVITNEAQQVVWRWENQEPFGKSPPEEDPDGDGVRFEFPLRFPGQYADRETGLFYNFHRDYDPATGRYVQADPIGLKGGMNPYRYALDPLSEIDPLGLQRPRQGSGNPRTTFETSVRQTTVLGQQGTWFYGRFYPRLGEPLAVRPSEPISAGNYCPAPAPPLTGQVHHAISRKVHDALEQHPILRGQYQYRDQQFEVQARDPGSHRGYETWHRNTDAEVAQWIRSNPNATPPQFESYLMQRYSQPDLLGRFPYGFK
jgi:RHS repeat-associated protein